MPSQIVLENISTNMKNGGDVFSFYSGGTSVPIKTNESGKWTIKVDNVETYRLRPPEKGYFGLSDNPAPIILDYSQPYQGVYTKADIDTLLAEKADITNVYTKAEVNQLFTSNEGTAADNTTYTKAQVNTLLDKKADVNHTHDDYVTKTAFEETLTTKLDANDNRIHDSRYIGSHNLDETGMDDGMILYYDASTKTYRFRKEKEGTSSNSTDSPGTLPTQTVVYTKSCFCDTTILLDNDETFTVPDGTTKFRITAVTSTDITISDTLILSLEIAMGRLQEKYFGVMWLRTALLRIVLPGKRMLFGRPLRQARLQRLRYILMLGIRLIY